jgi:hypothetical protein
MRLFLKTAFHRPFDYSELRQDADGFFVKPPLPPELLEAAATIRGKSGESLLDYWRTMFDGELREVCDAPTWKAQRATLLRGILNHTTWRTLYVAAKECLYPETWEHYADASILGQVEKSSRESVLFQRYLVAVTSTVCLQVLGERRYEIGQAKLRETDIFHDLDLGIKRLDFRLMDHALSVAEASDDEQAFALAAFKEDQVNPLIQMQMRALSIAQEQIVHGQLDIVSLRASISAVDKKRSEVTAQLKDLL